MDRVSFVQLCLPSPRGASPASVDLCSYRKCLDCTKRMCERSQRLFVKLVDDMVGLSADCIIEPAAEPLRPSHFGAIVYRGDRRGVRPASTVITVPAPRPARAPAARSRARTAVIPSDVCIRASSVALSGLWLSLNLPSGSTSARGIPTLALYICSGYVRADAKHEYSLCAWSALKPYTAAAPPARPG